MQHDKGGDEITRKEKLGAVVGLFFLFGRRPGKLEAGLCDCGLLSYGMVIAIGQDRLQGNSFIMRFFVRSQMQPPRNLFSAPLSADVLIVLSYFILFSHFSYSVL